MAATDTPHANQVPGRDYGKYQTDLQDKLKKDDVAQQQRGATMRRELVATLAAIEKERVEKIKKFKTDCSKELADHDSRVQDEQTKLKAKQAEHHATFLEKLKVDTEPKAPHGSQEYFRLRKIEDMLYQQKRYPEAQQHKERADALAKVEHAEWEETRNKRKKLHEEPFLQKQQQAAANFQQRSEAARLQLLNKHSTEKEKLQRLYDAKKAHAEEQHHFEMRKHEIYPGSTLNFANSLVLTKRSVGPDAAAPINGEAESRVWTMP